MNILYVTGEAAPFCKTGGLADVSGSLPVALAARGHRVAVILPLYNSISAQWREKMAFRRYIYVDLAWRHEYCGLFSLEHRGVTWYFVDNERYFARGRLYGECDDGERFAFFSRAVLDLLPVLDDMPEVIHCNDWQTALVPIYRQDLMGRWDALRGIRTVFTIHNVEYQGKFGADTVEDLFGLDRGWYEGGTLQMDGCVNLMKGAMLCADAVTTALPIQRRPVTRSVMTRPPSAQKHRQQHQCQHRRASHQLHRKSVACLWCNDHFPTAVVTSAAAVGGQPPLQVHGHGLILILVPRRGGQRYFYCIGELRGRGLEDLQPLLRLLGLSQPRHRAVIQQLAVTVHGDEQALGQKLATGTAVAPQRRPEMELHRLAVLYGNGVRLLHAVTGQHPGHAHSLLRAGQRHLGVQQGRAALLPVQGAKKCRAGHGH